MLDDLDRQIIANIFDDLPLEEEPYQYLAQRLQIPQEEILRRLQSYYETGKIRKIGAVLRHRKVGFQANALCALVVPPERQEEVGKFLISHSLVTHCYSRHSHVKWPYNFYIMVHAKSRSECREFVNNLLHKVGVTEYQLLFSTKEWKKVSMHYFSEGTGAHC